MDDRGTLEQLFRAAEDAGLTRREAVRRLGLGIGVLSTAGWLAACGDSDDDKKQVGAKKGGTLLVGAEADAYRTSGVEAGIGQYPLNANIFEGLVRMDPGYGIVPVLATSWSVKGNTWTFRLRENVKFHDGKPFTAEAVQHSFDRVAGLGGGTPGLAKKGTKIVDDLTVEVTPQFPNQRLVEQLVHPEYSIVAVGTDPVKEQIGTGPFKFGSYKREQEIVVDRFSGYWGGAALLDRIRFKFLPDANARRLALEGDEVNLILGVPNEVAKSLKDKGFEVHISPAGAYEAMYANIGGRKGYTLLQDSDVRRAIQYAIDRSALVNGVYNGQAHGEQTMIPSRVLGDARTAVKGYPHNPAMAQELLEKAGWTAGDGGIRSKGGKRLELELVSGFPSAAVHTGVPEFVQDQLKRVGIAVKIVKTPDDASYTARTEALAGDLWLERGNQNDANPSFLPALLFSKKGLFGPGDYQKMFAPGGDFDRLINEALSAKSTEEVQSLTAQAMAAIIDDEAIVIPLAGISQISASKGVTGFAPHASTLQVRYERVGLSA
jgi:peptide/nickel transport system substrate-binding protein